jgi:hypothetical protein
VTWTKISDDFSDDCYRLSDAAFRVHTEGIIWSNRKLLDCRIPKDDVRRFVTHLDTAADAIRELIELHFWEDDGDAYRIVHHAGYQRESEKVIKQQEANVANQAKRGKKAPASREIRREGGPSRSGGNESLNDSLNEVDRTGQDRAGTTAPTLPLRIVEDEVPPTVPAVVRNDTQVQALRSFGIEECRVCHCPLLHPESMDRGVCGKTDEAHARVRDAQTTMSEVVR